MGVAGVLAVISDNLGLRLVAVVIAVGAGILAGVALGSRPFRK